MICNTHSLPPLPPFLSVCVYIQLVIVKEDNFDKCGNFNSLLIGGILINNELVQ